jgi:hypothetical protein
MFELPLSQKNAPRYGKGAPDEAGPIQIFMAVHDFYEEDPTKISGFKIGRFWVDDNLKKDQILGAKPLCIVKRWNSGYPNCDYEGPPLFLMGAFFSGVRGDLPKLQDLNRNPPRTFSELRTKISQQDDCLEKGFNPIRKTHNWMKSGVSGYFVTGQTISQIMSQGQRNLLFGTAPG